MGRETRLKLRIFDTVNVDINLFVNESSFKTWDDIMFEIGFPDEFGALKCLDKFLTSYTEFGTKEFTGRAVDLLTEKESEILGIKETDTLKFVIKLKKASSINQVWQMSLDERLEFSQMMKVRGNDYVKKGEFAKATKIYRFTIKYIKANVDLRTNEVERNLYVSILSNLSLCYLKCTEDLTEHGEEKTKKLLNGVIYCCNEILRIRPTSTKAQFRLGQANARLQSYENAICAIEAALANLELDEEVKDKAATRDLFESACKKWKLKTESEKGECKDQVASKFRKYYGIDKVDPNLKGYRIVPEYVSKWYKTEFALDDDGSSDEDRLEIGTWSNDMADGIMSIPDELEAFGETMPELKKSARTNLASIDDVDENASDF